MTILHITIPGEPGVAYREIAIFDGYAVGDDGSVWSRRSLNGHGYGPWHRVIGDVANGYRRVGLRVGGRVAHKSVHRLVLAAFAGDRPDLEVRHLNGDRTDNRLTNLAWGTAYDNAVDRERHGNTLRGESHGRARITAADVKAIREMARSGATKAALAAQYGLGTTTIGHIITRKNWRHVE